MSGSPPRGARTAPSADGWPNGRRRASAEALHAAALRAYDQIIGLELGDIAVDGCLTKAPCGGERAGPSPVDRRKGGLKRSVASDGHGIPLGIASAGREPARLAAAGTDLAGRQHGSWTASCPQTAPATWTRGYDSTVTRQLLDELGFDGQIARKGIPAPIQAGTRWVVERTHSWMNGYGKLRRCTERNAKIVDFYLYLAAASSPSASSSSAPATATAGTPARPPSGSSDTYCRAL